DLSKVLIPSGLAIAVLGLILIEQLYRNSSMSSRWSLKPLVLGIGGLFAYDLFLYSQSFLLGAIDALTWTARGLVNVLFVPMIAIAARRNASWNVQLFVSRQVVFYSTALVATGVYLLLMSLGGYLIVQYGGSWGGVARIVFFAGAGLVLLTLLFSTALRLRLKVFLDKHFFHNKYDYREEWLRLVSLLSNFDSSSSQAIAVEALAQIVNSPSGAVWLREEEAGVFRLAGQFETSEEFPDIPLDNSLIAFIDREGWLVDLEEYAREPEKYQGLEMPAWLADSESAWLIVPLQLSGVVMGIVLLAKAPDTPRLNYEDRDLLKTVGIHIAVHLAQARADRQLAESRQFEAYNRLTAFLMHDLNNLIAQQSLIVANAEKHKRNPEFIDDAISTVASSVERMRRVMRQLKSGGAENGSKPVEIKFLVSSAVDRCSVGRPIPELNINGVNALIETDGEELVMILTHIIRNAQDACTDGDQVTVSLEHKGDNAVVVVSDTGAGMTAEFIRDRLFRPFDSTKGNQGMGIGAYQARDFARKLGGDLDVRSEPGVGTVVALSLPVRVQAAQS
ncbi:MAG: XrtA/PEP-CTERM system histidine kinase PrsK, partial [Pseudomonadota bacterium]